MLQKKNVEKCNKEMQRKIFRKNIEKYKEKKRVQKENIDKNIRN